MSDTKTKILDVAERLTQTKGFRGFSYLDLADEIGIKTASIHYHFKTKDDLAIALVRRTHHDHVQAFQNLDKELNKPQQRLQAVIDYFKGYITEQRFCLCGMMSVELRSVSSSVSQNLSAYFEDFQAWVATQFKAMGKKNSKVLALAFISALEGSLMLARLENNPEMVNEALKVFMKA